jgi:hypothetical protein
MVRAELTRVLDGGILTCRVPAMGRRRVQVYPVRFNLPPYSARRACACCPAHERANGRRAAVLGDRRTFAPVTVRFDLPQPQA